MKMNLRRESMERKQRGIVGTRHLSQGQVRVLLYDTLVDINSGRKKICTHHLFSSSYALVVSLSCLVSEDFVSAIPTPRPHPVHFFTLMLLNTLPCDDSNCSNIHALTFLPDFTSFTLATPHICASCLLVLFLMFCFPFVRRFLYE
jgi:hypothetical protein